MEEESREDEMLLFGDNISTYRGKYVLATKDCEYFKRVSSYKYIFLTSVSLAIAVLGAFPYTSYSEFLPDYEWGFICVLRTMVYILVFSSYIIHNVSRLNITYVSLKHCSLAYLLRVLFGILFAGLYSFLYSIKWLAHSDTPFFKVSIAFFILSWFIVYYSVIDRHLSNTISIAGIPSSVLSLRRKVNLLKSIQELQDLCFENDELCRDMFLCISVGTEKIYYMKLANSTLAQIEIERVHLYEEEHYDYFERIRGNLVNILLGISLVPLTLAMIEDYGYSFHQTFGDTGFLWVITILTSVLSVLYLTATYPIYHKLARISINKECLKWSVLKVVPLGCALAIASVRITASYSIFSKIAASMKMPYDIGWGFIGVGMAVVFLIDFLTCLKIVTSSFKRWISYLSICLNVVLMRCEIDPPCLLKYLSLRCYFKYMKAYVRDVNEDILEDVL